MVPALQVTRLLSFRLRLPFVILYVVHRLSGKNLLQLVDRMISPAKAVQDYGNITNDTMAGVLVCMFFLR